MKVAWEPRIQGRPLYLRVSGINGGEVEMKIDPVSGMLGQVVVIDVPPRVEVKNRIPLDGVDQNLTPILDRSIWGWKETPDGATLDGSVASSVEELGFIQSEERIGLVFSDREPVRYLRCEDIAVAVSDDGALVEISAFL
ncbi:hypothetical protein ACFWP2_25470 [Kitasatospora sp. NPDC058444]|uniref:hypothetical protein n=1 Tax=Kitasatospora sp. NPDC058444 TaxID=3346504 RepID=UPI0036628FD7